MTSSAPGSVDEGGVSVTAEIGDDRTEIVVERTRDTAVVVRSASGERVYLPPAKTTSESDPESTGQDDSPYEGVPNDSPYEGVPNDSPYEGVPNDSPYSGFSSESPYEGVPDDSPYESSATPETTYGVVPTEDGFRIVHPEPAEDVRFLG